VALVAGEVEELPGVVLGDLATYVVREMSE